METKLNEENIKIELNNIADDNDLTDGLRAKLIKIVINYHNADYELLDTWDKFYAYVDGLMTKFE